MKRLPNNTLVLPNNTLVPHMIRLPCNTYKRIELAHRKNI